MTAERMIATGLVIWLVCLIATVTWYLADMLGALLSCAP